MTYSWGNPDVNTSANGGYQIFNAILGWNNTATYGTVISYCLYWVCISIYLVYLRFKEKRQALAENEKKEKESFDRNDSDATISSPVDESAKALEESRTLENEKAVKA
jgi:high-affinity iron transporter